MKKYLLVVMLITLVLPSCVKEKIEVTAPDFSLSDLKGNTITLSDFRGKVVFLNFWATWCSPCKAEIPGFVEMYDTYKDKGMEIIGISVDTLSPRLVLIFAEQYKMNYPVVMGIQQLINDYKPGRGVPVTFVIDQQGKIRHKHIGYMDKETLKNFFVELQEKGE